MRNTVRPPPIHVPFSNSSIHNRADIETTSSIQTLGTFGVSSLAIQSPFTPGPTTAVYYRPDPAYTPGPTTAVYFNRAFRVPRHVATAWQGRFTFFHHFPPEIRERIYEDLIEDVIVLVNANNFRSVRAYKRKPLSQHEKTSPYITLPYRSVLRPNTNWLCISRQFFFESRRVLWRSMVVKFQRRWDFVNASLKGTLTLDAMRITPSGMDAPVLFPLKTDVMSHIRELHLNLTSGTDFNGRVTVAEASRVTSSMLEYIAQGMPMLRSLFFIVDNRSRLSSSVIAFIPDAWFLEALLAIKHVSTMYFFSGPGWKGHAQNKKNARSCLDAMNAALAGHLATPHPVFKLNADGVTGVKLQARLGRRMLYHFHTRHPQFKDAESALAMKIVMLEANI
ncbi:hypothetical protein PMZ80_009391 [Knufia obscura]|uniref:Uncharacterized protein n=1 Tax=Knufia obscura TaxID=1635080 RepID=A0ABR0RCS9_9EURO|nr:hypothetical protein PMZ80_009391 [Knufia obscura]